MYTFALHTPTYTNTHTRTHTHAHSHTRAYMYTNTYINTNTYKNSLYKGHRRALTLVIYSSCVRV